MNTRPRELSIVLPCYNESRNLPLVTERFANFYPGLSFELILVNNGSTDSSAEVMSTLAEQYPFVKIVTIEKNIGYGHGIMTGLRAAAAEVVSYSHADIQTPPEDVFKAFDLWKKQPKGTACFIKGQRINRPSDQMFFTNYLSRIVQLILGYKLEDINAQPKLFPREMLAACIAPPDDFSLDIYLMYVAAITGKALVTFPVNFGERIYGESNWSTSFSRKLKTVAKYLFSILAIARKHYNEPHNILKQSLRFLCTGVLANLTNYLVFLSGLWLLHVYYLLASVIGFIAGFIVGFFLNKNWTFESRGKSTSQFAGFLVLNLISLAIFALTIYLATDLIGIRPELSQLLGMAISTLINFFGSKLFVFRQQQSTQQE